MSYCGIDLASKASAFCIVNKQGDLLEEFESPTDEDGFRTYLQSYCSLKCVVEASPLAAWSVRTLEKQGHEVIIIDARRAKAVVCTKKKTDRTNAQDLAHMARTGWYTEVHRKSESARELRTYLMARSGLVETSNAMNARIRGLLRSHGIKLGAVPEREFEAKVQGALSDKASALRGCLIPLLEIWRQAIDEAEVLLKTIKARAKQNPVCQRLMTVPGIGPLSAVAYVATIDTPERFKRSSQVGAYLGLVPSVYQSGEIDYRGRITKEGDHLLRWLLTEAAHCLLTNTRRQFALKRWGQRLEKQKGVGKARVAVARKLAIILHRLWLTGEAFDWQRV